MNNDGGDDEVLAAVIARRDKLLMSNAIDRGDLSACERLILKLKLNYGPRLQEVPLASLWQELATAPIYSDLYPE